MDFFTSETLLSLFMLTAMEIVLGVDNIIFISILAGRLPAHEQEKARRLGLTGAVVSRLALLSAISWLTHLTTPLFELFGVSFSGKALVLLLGGLFLIYKATNEIHHKLEDPADQDRDRETKPKHLPKLAEIVLQIMILDLVFSLDSVITAVGMASKISIMVVANIIALIVMVGVGGKVNHFVNRHPTVKMLALSFLLMIGLTLIADGLSFHIPKGYLYSAMAFSIFVEVLNIRVRKKAST